jgi:hypothetical protein
MTGVECGPSLAGLDGFSRGTRRSRQYLGLRIPNEDLPPQISDTTLLVRPDRAIAQRERERAEQEAARAAAAAAAGNGTVDTASGPGTAGGTNAVPPRGLPDAGSGSMPGPHGSTPPASSGLAAPPLPRNTRFSVRSASTGSAMAVTSTGCTRRSSSTSPLPREGT